MNIKVHTLRSWYKKEINNISLLTKTRIKKAIEEKDELISKQADEIQRLKNNNKDSSNSSKPSSTNGSKKLSNPLKKINDDRSQKIAKEISSFTDDKITKYLKDYDSY